LGYWSVDFYDFTMELTGGNGEEFAWFGNVHERAATGTGSEGIQQTLQRLRQENTDLRELVQLYAEQIRQLAVDRHDLTLQVEQLSGVTRIGRPGPS
jgi:20S proteasome alpha/beta subunit